MIALLDRAYAFVLEGLVLLGGNPLACAAVGFLGKMTLWLAALLVLRLVAEVLYVAWLRRTNPPVEDARQRLIFERCRLEAGLGDSVELRTARLSVSPAFTAGVIHPAVYLAPELAAALDDAELESVLRHELAHVERHDNLVLRMGRVLSAAAIIVLVEAVALAAVMGRGLMHFGFWNAVALLLVGFVTLALLRRSLGFRFATHIEICCDARVVSLGGDPLALASAILKTSRWRPRRYRFADAVRMLSPCARMIDARVRHLVGERPRLLSPLALDRRLRIGFIVALAVAALYVHDFHQRSESTGARSASSQISRR